MPTIKSAKKRVKTIKTKTAINKKWRVKLKEAIKTFEQTVKEKSVEDATEKLNEANKIIDKCVKQGIIHKNNAARKKSRLAKMLNKVK